MQTIKCTILVVSSILSMGTATAAPRQEPIQPIETPAGLNPAKVELGKQLFFDPRLSMSGIISCNSCHNLSLGGTDNLKTSIGHKWQAGPVNSPTVFNSSLSIAQFWDGRAANLKEQAAGPIKAPVEMAMPHTLATELIATIPGYVSQIEKIYGKKTVSIDQITDAIAEFEKTLVTPNSRFDQWLKGDDKALSPTELAGYELFKNSGCIGCHNGSAVGGTSFQKMGLIADYKSSSPAQGRAGVTGKDAERFMFKVPTLRNVELTYPYFHDGEAESLEKAVDIMGRLQLGRQYTPEEISRITAFLKTLTGDRPKISLPLLPPSSGKTPHPQPYR